MGFACELFVAGAITATFNINSGVENPDRVCAVAAVTLAVDRPVGTSVVFKLSNDGVNVPAGSGTVVRNPDKANPYPGQQGDLTSVTITPESGAPKNMLLNPMTIPKLKENVARDTTRAPGR